jgi:MFS family permease
MQSPPPPTNRLENLQTLRLANLDAAFYTAFATLVGGTFMVGFIKELGGADIWIGLLTAVPSLLGLLQIPGAIIGRSFNSFKPYIARGGFFWRFLYVPFIPLPLLPINPELKLGILFVCVAISSASWLMVTPIYNDWLAEMVSPTSRGWYFSRRNAIATAVGAAAGMVGGVVLDHFRHIGKESLGFSIIFGMGVATAAVSFAVFLQMRDMPRAEPVKASLKEGFRAFLRPYQSREFRRVLMFLFWFIFGQAFAGILFSAFAIETLKLEFTIIQATGVAHAIGNLASAAAWGFLADKYGNKPVLVLSGFGLTLTPVMWLFCQPGQTLYNALILIPSHLLVGAVWAGVGLCQFNLLLSTADPKDRPNFIGSALALQAVVGGIAPLCGAWMLGILRGQVDAEQAYKLVFGAAMAFRFFSVFLLLRVREEGSAQVMTAIHQIRKTTPRGLRAMRRLARSGDVSAREEAIEKIGTHHVALAADEIIQALHDPSPRIRRQAASTLAQLGDPRATEALIHQLHDHPDLVEEETVEAIGDLRDPRAVGPLVQQLASPRSMLRRAAARALGRIGSQEAVGALMQSASEPGDPDLRRASLQALRVLGATQAEEVIADALFDPTPSVRIAAAEAVSELGLKGAAPHLRDSLSYYADEASSEVAYALGTVGDELDVPLILDRARECVSVITRRRCLLGVARIYGAEQDLYKLLLLEGMSRDSAVLAMLRPLVKTSNKLRTALDLYSSGREAEALDHLAHGRNMPELKVLAKHPVQELFLLAAILFARRHSAAERKNGS